MDEFVIQQLKDLGLEEYVPIFLENEIDEDAFTKLEMEDLKGMIPGKVGPQRKIYNAILDYCLRVEEPNLTHIENESTINWVTAHSSEIPSNFLDSPRMSLWDVTIEGGVILYIDNSNIFINSQKHAARLHKFQYGIASDKRCRIDVGKLVAKATRGRDILVANLYGSEPPLLDTVWKSIREKSVKVMTHKKSAWTNREKQIDTSLVADAVEGITQYVDKAGDNRAVILFTGDKDMLTVIKKARKYDWRVEIWSYDAALSNDIKKEAKQSQNAIKIMLMDDYFKECTFSLTLWKKRYIPPERSMVMLFAESYIEDLTEAEKGRIIREIVNSSTEIFRVPTLAQFLAHKFEVEDNSASIPTANRFVPTAAKAQLEQFISIALVCIQAEGPRSTSADLHEGGHHHADTGNRPMYSFTKDIWTKRIQLLQSVPECSDIITFQQYRQGVQIPHPDETVDGELDEDDFDLDDPDSLDLDYRLVEKKMKRTNQQFSELCSYTFRCRDGVKCKYGHRDQEKEYFKHQPRAKRYLYKTKLCTHALIQTCKYQKKPYLCSYAHDFHECMCIFCLEIGVHWADECPDRKNQLGNSN